MLDYTLHSAEERVALVNKIIDETPPEQLTPQYINALTEYLLFTRDKGKDPSIIKENRKVTLNRRETSFEGLCGKLENGEDGLYNLISDLGKNTILTIKDPITDQDRAQIPELAALQDAVQRVEAEYQTATGRRKYLLKKQIIEMRQDQYVIRNDYRGRWGGHSAPTVKSMTRFDFSDSFSFDSNGNPVNNGILSFFNPKHIQALLCNYSALKEAAYGNFENDLYYLMEDLDDLIERTLKDAYPLYYDLLIYKIDGRTNLEIQQIIADSHQILHSVEYLSSLWRNKIPKLLAEQAQKDYLIWYYTNIEKGQWKKCSRCGQIKLAHNKFFSKNKCSKDGWYSLCKECRNAKTRQKREQAARIRYLRQQKTD